MINNVIILYALIIAGSVGSVTGYLGSLMVTKRMALMSGALGHLTLPGIALGFLYGIDVSACALLFLLLGSLAIWWVEQKTQLPVEAVTAVVFSSSLAISFLILPEAKAQQALLGDMSQVTALLTIVTSCICLGIYLIIRRYYSGLVLMSISQDIAHTMGINCKRYNLVYLISIALVVALGVRIIGGLMTSALVAIPACASKNISTHVYQYAYISFMVGGVSCLIATALSFYLVLPVGPLIVIVNGCFFIGSLFFRCSKKSF